MELRVFLHICLESGCALLCILAALNIHLYKAFSPDMAKTLTGGLLTNAVINIADMLAYFFRGTSTQTGAILVRLSNFVVFAGMFVLLAFGGGLLDKSLEHRGGGKDKKLRNAAFNICSAGLLLLVASRIFGFLYGFDEHNYYYRDKGYILLPLTAIVAILLMIVRTVKERRSLKKGEFAVYMCFWLLPVAGAVLQVFFYGISLSNIANTISIVLMLSVFMRDAISEISIRKSFLLSGESIEAVSEDLEVFLDGTGTEKQNRIRIRFTVEDALFRLWRKFGDLNMVRVTAGIRLGNPTIRIEHEGEAFNPFIKTGSTVEDWSSGLLTLAGLSPSYTYSHGTNIMKIPLGRVIVNPVVTLLIAIVFGLITGNVASVALSAADTTFVTNGLLAPVYDLWNNILYSVSAPAMLIIVIATMLDTKEISEQGGNAGLITGRYFVISIVAGVAAFAGAGIFRPEVFARQTLTKAGVSDLIRKLFSVVPQNIIDPFRDFNTAQLILMGIVLAYATMAVGQQAGGIASLIHELNMISTKLAQWIAGMVPIFTIFLTAQLVLENNAELLIGLFRIIPFALFVSLVVMLVTLIYVSKRTGTDLRLLVRKLWPSFLLTLKTGQVADSYALAEQCCRRELGVQKLFTQRVLPLGLVLYMPISVIGMISFVLYAAARNGIAITPEWMFTTTIFALILLVAAPPIPGVDLLSYVVILDQLGIEKKYIIAAVVFDIVFNMFACAANQMMLQLDILLQADRVGLLDHKKLNAGMADR